MSNVEITVDDNMNKTEMNELSKPQKTETDDLEKGMTSKPNVVEDRKAWSRGVALFLAVIILIAACTITWIYQDWQTSLQIFAILVAVYILVFLWRWIYVAIRTTPRDMSALYAYVKILLLTKKFGKKNWAITEIFHENVKKHPNKACLIFQDETWTFKQIEEFSLRVTAVLKAQGMKPGHTVGVMMNNCPEFPAMWLGICRAGGVSPLINTNQKGNALLHSVNVAKCDFVIHGAEFEEAFQEISKELPADLKLLSFTRRLLKPLNDTVNVVNDSKDFTSLLETTAPANWSSADSIGFNDKLLYIYTSGTTGLPKAAVISSSRITFMSSGMFYLGKLSSKDVIYCPMPLYHTAGCCVTMGLAFIFGCTVVLKTKFSASQYFPDCIKYNCTVAHYIGEMCRYVLATPPSPTDTQHKVKKVYGNGMRPAIWTDFVKRFNIKQVIEFYGATEGNANIVNNDNRTGAIGFVSRIIPAVYPIAIIKVDQETGEPIRNAKGLCQLANPNEPGAFIGKINPNIPSRAYLGYVDKQASEKKVIRDVFSKGDSAFISGDILVADELGYLYFKDRTGDTFRWRGENVSTTEVEAAVSTCADQRDAVVYGVEIPNIEGRAGMCGILDQDGTLNLEEIAQKMSKDIPAYARPVFIRILTSMDITGTFKMKKIDLQKEGFDPNKVSDKLYYLDPKLGKYLPLGKQEYEKIVNGQIRL